MNLAAADCTGAIGHGKLEGEQGEQQYPTDRGGLPTDICITAVYCLLQSNAVLFHYEK